MKMILAALIATTALVVGLSHGMEDDPLAAHARNDQANDFILISGDVECRISQDAGSEKIARFKLESACAGPAHPASKAAMIEQHEDGTIDLIGEDGNAVVRFATAEGGTHVSYEPQSPLIRLVAVD